MGAVLLASKWKMLCQPGEKLLSDLCITGASATFFQSFEPWHACAEPWHACANAVAEPWHACAVATNAVAVFSVASCHASAAVWSHATNHAFATSELVPIVCMSHIVANHDFSM